MKKVKQINNTTSCKANINAIKDTMALLSGKWKFHILGTLLEGGKMRFMDLLREVDGIAPKMLSKELQDMEINRLLTRTALATKPITVQYELTAFGNTLKPIIDEMAKWGIAYQNAIYSQKE